MSTPGPDHEAWGDAVGAYLLGALDPEEHTAFEAHLEHCPVCARDVATLRVAADALPVSVPLVRPPDALRDRIMSVVRSEAELLSAAGSRADVPAEPPAPAAAAGPRARRSLTAWFARPAVALACALALLAGGGAAGALLARDGGAETRTVVAQTAPGGADVRLVIGEESATLVARDMPAPPEGRVYQVWLQRPGGDPVPTAALWSVRSDGTAEVAVPGSLDGIEAVLVTAEPQGGSAAPTAEPVISASPA